MIIFILHADQLTRFIILQGVGILRSVTKEAPVQYSFMPWTSTGLVSSFP